jgi:hypothetical protein
MKGKVVDQCLVSVVFGMSFRSVLGNVNSKKALTAVPVVCVLGVMSCRSVLGNTKAICIRELNISN